jgi:excisionase family DNA binding protein
MTKRKGSTLGANLMDLVTGSADQAATPADVKKHKATPLDTLRDKAITRNGEERQRAARRTKVMPVAIERNVLTREEAAEVLGVSPVTLTRWAQEGKIGHVLFGGRARFHREDISRFEQGLPPRPEARVGWEPSASRVAKAKAVWAERKGEQ